MGDGFSGLGRIAQVAVNARSIDRATAFYRDTLGMTHLFSAPPKMAFFDCAGVWLMLGEAESEEFDHPSSVLYFEVADIDAAHRALAARGVEFRDSPHLVHRAPDWELWLAFFRDSEGNTHALRERRAR
jgi:methylmalonyl-CoA/ethylmalonyl-CoA epimerase